MEITKNFNSNEFKCPCCNVTKYDIELIKRLQMIRNIMGIPIVITSGYRCLHYNTKIRGHERSLHMQGIAADVMCESGRLAELNMLCKAVFFDSGVGTYTKHVHVDMGKYLRFNGYYK